MSQSEIQQIIPAAGDWRAAIAVLEDGEDAAELRAEPLVGWALTDDADSGEVVGMVVAPEPNGSTFILLCSDLEGRPSPLPGSRAWFLGYLRPGEVLTANHREDADDLARDQIEKWSGKYRDS